MNRCFVSKERVLNELKSMKLFYAAEFTNRLSRLLEAEEIQSEETNHIFAKVLKELGNEVFLIA
ncbi:TPA: hypothetical protein ACGN81_005249 [Bacillus cereus]